MYRELDPNKIVTTVDTLHTRIEERFPGSSLGKVVEELCDVARHAEELSLWLRKPNAWVRGGSILAIALIIAVVVGGVLFIKAETTEISNLWEFAQILESVVNDLVFLGLALFFLASGETRVKRKRALEAIHVLRSMAHIIDMHQLTKDPEQYKGDVVVTPSSPKRTMTRFEFTRYLDYCSEALAIISKIAAVYVANFADSVTLSAVNEIENLTTALSRKIWQKVMIVDTVDEAPRDQEPRLITR